jgi:hypothetical protein
MKKRRAYLSGPMSGYKDWNIPFFNEVAGILRSQNWEILNPGEWEEQQFRNHAECLRFDILQIVQDKEIDHIILLPGWQDSKGAVVEFVVAKALNLKCLEYVDYGDNGELKLRTLSEIELNSDRLIDAILKRPDVLTIPNPMPLPPAQVEVAAKAVQDFWSVAPSTPTPAPPKESVCLEADRLVSGDRNADYGHPIVDFSRSAKIWEAILGFPVSAPQVGLCMIGVKISRECNKHKRDNLTDICGYAKCTDMIADKIVENQATYSVPNNGC